MAFYEVVFNWQLDQITVNNVFHYDITAVTPADLQGYADTIQAEFILHLQSVCAPSMTFNDLTFREDIPGGVGITQPFTTGPVSGTSTDDQYAGQLSAIVRKLAQSTVRPNIGRVYWAGITSEGLGANGRWTSTVTTAAANFLDALIGVSSGAGGVMDMHIKASDPTKPNTVPYNPVTAVQALAIPGTQRRRREGVGI